MRPALTLLLANLFFLGTCLVGILSCSKSYSDKPSPQARNGVLDLRDWNFNKDGPVELKGEWEFHWKKHILPGNFPAHKTPPGGKIRLIKLPRAWNQETVNGEEIGPLGFATFRLRVLQNKSTDLASGALAAIRFRNVGAAMSAYLNGQKFASIGVVGADPDSMRPDRRNLITRFAPGAYLKNKDEFELVLHVSNFHYHQGGVIDSVLLGAEKDITLLKKRRSYSEFFLFGAILIMGLYHLGLYFFRPTEKSPLYFALFCFIICDYILLTGENHITYFFPDAPWFVTISLLYLPVSFSMPLFYLFLRSIFPKILSKNLFWHILTPGLLFFISIHLIPRELVSGTLLFHETLLTLFGFYLTWKLFQAKVHRQKGGLVFFVGFTVLFLTAINDILYYERLINSEYLLPLGQFGFIFSQAILLSIRFTNAFNDVELLSNEIRQKNTELLRLDKLKDEFLANTSHELRTPLNGIIGIAESLLSGVAGPLNEKSVLNLTLISNSGRRLSNLVNDILDFSKLRGGDIKLIKKPTDLGGIAEMVITLSRPLVGNRPLKLINNIDGMPPVDADENRLEQILHNLVGNALKFTQTGQIELSCRPFQGFLEVVIADTGIGIPPEKLDLIFDSFVQGEGSYSREFGGTGLGLSITRSLIELHGGEIRAESTLGKGSRFVFTLPLYIEPEKKKYEAPLLGEIHAGNLTAPLPPELDQTPDSYSPEDIALDPPEETFADSAGTEQAEKTRILIVDDDPINLQVLKNHLSLKHYDVTEARSGSEALKILDLKKNLDLILLDVMMPGMSGYDVCRRIREHKSPSELPVILLTAQNRVGDLVMGLESGANDYLSKPFDPMELLARVRTMIDIKNSAGAQSNLAAIENELEIARQLQESLLPDSVPKIPGLDIAARYHAMASVGGDFYEFHHTGDKLGVIMADVSGHGVPAALVVSMVKIAFWFQKDLFDVPDRVFDGVNKILYGNIKSEFVTGCYVYIDRSANKLVTSNAGHPPILVWKKSTRTLIKLRPPGRLLGIFSDPVFETESVELEDGDRVILYTDGLFETANETGTQLGEKRLHDIIASIDSLPANDFADRLIQEVTNWSGKPEHPQDDIALIVIDAGVEPAQAQTIVSG